MQIIVLNEKNDILAPKKYHNFEKLEKKVAQSRIILLKKKIMMRLIP